MLKADCPPVLAVILPPNPLVKVALLCDIAHKPENHSALKMIEPKANSWMLPFCHTAT